MAGTFPVKQLYDEKGNPFYPITHVDLVIGDKEALLNTSSAVNTIDLSQYLVSPFTGSFKLHTMNNFIYVYEGCLNTDSEDPIPYDNNIIVAKGIPEKFRSTEEYIPCSSVQGFTDSVVVYIDTNGSLIMRVTPSAIYKDDTFYSTYKTSINGLSFNGLYLKRRLEE